MAARVILIGKLEASYVMVGVVSFNHTFTVPEDIPANAALFWVDAWFTSNDASLPGNLPTDTGGGVGNSWSESLGFGVTNALFFRTGTPLAHPPVSGETISRNFSIDYGAGLLGSCGYGEINRTVLCFAIADAGPMGGDQSFDNTGASGFVGPTCGSTSVQSLASPSLTGKRFLAGLMVAFGTASEAFPSTGSNIAAPAGPTWTDDSGWGLEDQAQVDAPISDYVPIVLGPCTNQFDNFNGPTLRLTSQLVDAGGGATYQYGGSGSVSICGVDATFDRQAANTSVLLLYSTSVVPGDVETAPSLDLAEAQIGWVFRAYVGVDGVTVERTRDMGDSWE